MADAAPCIITDDASVAAPPPILVPASRPQSVHTPATTSPADARNATDGIGVPGAGGAHDSGLSLGSAAKAANASAARAIDSGDAANAIRGDVTSISI